MNTFRIALMTSLVLSTAPFANAQSVRLKTPVSVAATVGMASETEFNSRILGRYTQLWNLYRVRSEKKWTQTLTQAQNDVMDALRNAADAKQMAGDQKRSPELAAAFDNLQAKRVTLQAKQSDIEDKRTALDRLVPTYKSFVVNAKVDGLPKTSLEEIHASLSTEQVYAAVKTDSVRLQALLKKDNSPYAPKQLTYLNSLIRDPKILLKTTFKTDFNAILDTGSIVISSVTNGSNSDMDSSETGPVRTANAQRTTIAR